MNCSEQRPLLQVSLRFHFFRRSICHTIGYQSEENLSIDFFNLNSLDLTHWTPSMKEIFMHIGNVKELILSGNEISSVQGLDRLFSLERLSLDENKIEHLADISRLAKLPFLMNLDIKGNPLEIAGKISVTNCATRYWQYLFLIFILSTSTNQTRSHAG